MKEGAKANIAELNELHANIASVLNKKIKNILANPTQEYDDKLIKSALTFLKDNNITVDLLPPKEEQNIFDEIKKINNKSTIHKEQQESVEEVLKRMSNTGY